MKLTLTILLTAATAFAADRKPFSVVEASIPEMQAAMKSGRVTSHDLVVQYLTRIGMYEDRLHAALYVNPNAIREADERDRERAQGKIRGPLHGIPIALKDNIHTTNMPTTGGALAFDGYVPPYEATVTKNLRDAGAIIIAKTGMTELANWVAGAPPMPANGGSSSGVGTNANFWTANIGTETSGSILSPTNANMLAGIKPTVGRVSRYGVIPITADQDTPGPMAKSVTDAAIVFGAIEGNAPDPNDPATTRCPRPGDYTQFLKRDGLKGARIGIPRAFFYDKVTPPGADKPRGGLNAEQAKVMADAIDALKREGAVIVDPVAIPSVVDTDPKNNLLLWGVCTDMDEVKERKCSIDLAYGMERDFNKWLASLGPSAPVKSLSELRKFNRDHTKAGSIKYGQSLLDISDAMDLETFKSRYESDRARDIFLAGTHGIDEAMKTNNLDALLFPGPASAAIASRPGYPTVLVPFGFVPNAPTPAFPETFNAKQAPYGVGFTGMACSEPTLIRLAYAFEQATKKRVTPPLFP
jgi:amidase